MQKKQLQERITGSEAVEKLNLELNKHFQEVFAELTLKIQPSKEENIKLEDAFKKNYSISVERAGTERKETFLQNGHGVIRQALFNFLTFLKRENEGNKKQYIILFEEPELFYTLKSHLNYEKVYMGYQKIAHIKFFVLLILH
nr:hypothetical protein [Bacteroides intestinalis]